jgi:16S rRNA G966 N2-methylase RsmD
MEGRKRRYCTRRCRNAAHYRRYQGAGHGIPEAPVLHLGRFEDYAAAYAGKIDVIITDPPYANKDLPVFGALAAFAETVLVPGGWIVMVLGYGMIPKIYGVFEASTLEFRNQGCYLMLGPKAGQVEQYGSTGKDIWQQHHKPILCYRKPGTPFHKRRAGTTDLIKAEPDMDQKTFRDQQSLVGFMELIRVYTNRGDVIMDPCAGWGTTLRAAVARQHRRVIGIERNRERFEYACQQLGLVPPAGQVAQSA